MGIRSIVHALVGRAGYSVSRKSRIPSPFEALGVDLVVDVGANVGQFAEGIRRLGYKRRIVSFEPLPTEHAALLRASADDPLWDIHSRTALGRECGEALINISGNSYSSSLLPMGTLHVEASPGSDYVAQIRTPVVPLDLVYKQYYKPDSTVYVKIDTQGYEMEVLLGMPEFLKHVSAVQVEMSIVPLYQGQPLYPEIFDYFNRNGFSLWSLEPGFRHPKSGRMLQFDGLFFRN